MSELGVDFTEIILNDPSVVERLDQFLSEREELLEDVLKTPLSQEQANSWLWEHVELLEGCIKELFAQQEGVNIDTWQPSLRAVVGGCEQVLLNHLSATTARVEQVDKGLREKSDKWFKNWRSSLDPELLRCLHRNKKLLKQQYERFIVRYNSYIQRVEEINPQVNKLKDYEVLAVLGPSAVNDFKRFYRLLKLCEGDHDDLCLAAIKRLPREKITVLLKSYLSLLEQVLFDKSRILKTTQQQLFSEPEGRSFFLETLRAYRCEVHTLGASIAKYRKLILSTDPNPYIRTRLGFTDETVGPEPKYAATLGELEYAVEELDLLYTRMIGALERGPDGEEIRLAQADHGIQRHLHLIGQPLLSEGLFRRSADKILAHLDVLDEVGSYGREIVDYTRGIFNRLLRAARRSSTLYEMPQFQRLYHWHQKIIGPTIDENHKRRLSHLKSLVERLLRKSEAREEIDEELSDIKGDLQDFLATLQRSLEDESISPQRSRRYVEEAAQQLLEYRYLFAGLFTRLQKNSDNVNFQNKFLFVSYYFKSIEDRIQAFRLQHRV